VHQEVDGWCGTINKAVGNPCEKGLSRRARLSQGSQSRLRGCTASWSSQDPRGGCEGVVGTELVDRRAVIAGTVLYNPIIQKEVPPSHLIMVERDRVCCARLHWLVGPVPLNSHFTLGGPNSTVARDGSTGISVGL